MAIEAPIFLVGWFRSGTTMFWKIFRDCERYRCFYEPMHEHLQLYVKEGHSRVDRTHDGVEDYWGEYLDLEKSEFLRRWKPWFGRERWLLEANEEADDLKHYLDFLIAASDSKRPVLKFVRAGFRVEWLRANYPEARIIHVARNPRAVWSSMMGRDCDDDTQFHKLGDRATNWLRVIDKFCTELGLPEQRHPYRRFYLMWVLMCQRMGAVVDETWWYEDAVEGGAEWVREKLIAPGYLESFPDTKISSRSLEPKVHTQGWYWENEIAALAGIATLPASDKDSVLGSSRQTVRDLRRLEDRYESLFLNHEALTLDYVRLSERRSKEEGRFACHALVKILKQILKICFIRRKRP